MSQLTGVAKAVHDKVLNASSDAEAALYVRMVVGDLLAADMVDHGPVLQHRLDQVVAKRAERVRQVVLRSAVSKRMAGEQIDHLLAAAEVISKDAWDESEVNRDAHGRFSRVESRRRIGYQPHARPVPRRHARSLGVPESVDLKGLKGSDAAAYQQAYSQVAAMTSPYAQMPHGESVLQLTVQPKAGRPYTKLVDMPGPNEEILRPQDFADGSRVVEAAVLTNPGLSVRGAAFDLVGALGGSTGGVLASRTLERDSTGTGFKSADRFGSFARDWNHTDPGDVGNPRAGIFRRMSAGSRLLLDALGPVLPERAKLALTAGDFVGQYGAQAEKVIGPSADKAAYRYRGIERAPEPGLQRAVQQARSRYPNTPEGRDKARRDLIYGKPAEYPVGRGADARVVTDAIPSPVVNYLRSRLPDKDLVRLQAASGTITPSEGVIIDRSGKVVTQAVGYGEDWYLPFNLKNLSKLNGGEYVRTRVWGGPTTEDIYTGLISGARAVTVVSHNGVYTVEFDPAFRGSRRYSDKAGRMVKRYGQLLDAVKSRQVTLSGIPESRLEELETEAARYYHPREERRGYLDKLEELKAEERTNPQMSEQDRRNLAIEFLKDKVVSETGEPQSWDELALQLAERDVARMRRESTSPHDGFDEVEARRMAAGKVNSPVKVIMAMGPSMTESWNRHLAAKAAEYKAAQSPLNLDGRGYARSLDALKEQFPYYIDSVHFQPNRFGGVDRGYVKPRHTRPEGALAGYFDASIEGTGKVSADQIRWQNGKDPAKARPFTGRRETPGDDGRAIGGTAGGTPPSSDTPGAATALREQSAVTSLWKQLNAKKDGEIELGPHAGKRQATAPLASRFPTIFGMSQDDFARAYRQDPAKTKATLLEEAEKLSRLNIYRVDNAALDAVRDPAAAVRGRKWNLLEAFSSPSAVFDFDGLGAGRTPDAYEGVGERTLAQLGLGAKFSDEDLEDKLTSFIADKQAEYLRLAERPSGFSGGMERIEHDVERAAKVRQAKRRYREAVAAADAKVSADAAPKAQPNVVMINVKPGESAGGYSDLSELLRDAQSGEVDWNDLTRNNG